MNISGYAGHKANGQLGPASLDPRGRGCRDTRKASVEGLREAGKPASLLTAGL